MRLRILCTLILGVAACESRMPNDPEELVWTDNVEASAHAQVISQHSAESVLVVTLSLHNKSQARHRIVVLADCPVIVRMQSAASPDSPYAYDESGRPCTRMGRSVDLQPGEVEVMKRSIPISELRQLGITPGQYRVFVTPTTGPEAPQVDAGEVNVPSYTKSLSEKS